MQGEISVNVDLTFLTSYEHMGRFQVSCQPGCTCGAEIDGHREGHYSVPLMKGIAVTASEGSCTLVVGLVDDSFVHQHCLFSHDHALKPRQVKVLERTNSGEHKVKIIQITLTTSVDVTELLSHGPSECTSRSKA